VEHVLRELRAADGLSIELLPIPAEPRAAARRPPALFRLVEAIERLAYADDGDALASADPAAGLPTRRLDEPSDWEAVQERIARCELDLVVALCPLGPELLALGAAAPHGLWSLRHGREADPPGTWLAGEVSSPATAIEIRLEERRGPGGAATVLASSFQACDPISLHRTRSAAAWKGAHLVTRTLRRLPAGPLPPPAPAATSNYHWRATNAASVRLLVTLALRVARRRLRERLWWNQWFVAYRVRGDGDGLAGATLVASPEGRSLMDPCPVDRHGEHVIFVEDYSRERGSAVISYLRLDEGGGCTGPFPALQADHHLSYPFVFEWEGELYMIPETTSARQVVLYRARRFPDRWERVATLLDDVVAADPTLCEHGGRLWLFANIPDHGVSIEDELHVFHSDSLLGTWYPHRLNPVVSDVRRARPAGGLFRRDGQLIRPGQDSSRTYGGAVVFNRVDVLTVDDYRETTVGRIDPGWTRGNLGTHCYGADSVYEVVDGRHRRFRMSAPRLRRARVL
jgi:hypothetical protein